MDAGHHTFGGKPFKLKTFRNPCGSGEMGARKELDGVWEDRNREKRYTVKGGRGREEGRGGIPEGKVGVHVVLDDMEDR